MPPLSPRASRALVFGLVAIAILIAGVATLLILRSWEDRALQDELREVRRERGMRY